MKSNILCSQRHEKTIKILWIQDMYQKFELGMNQGFICKKVLK